MDSLIASFQDTGRFAREIQAPSRDRIRYTVHANRVLARKALDLSVGTTLLATVPLDETWIASSIRLHNTSTTNTRTVTLRDVPYGSTNILTNQWCHLDIAPNETIYLYGIEEVWDGGYQIHGWCDAANEVLVKIQGTPLVDA